MTSATLRAATANFARTSVAVATLIFAACAKEPVDVPRVELTDGGGALTLPAPAPHAPDSATPGPRHVSGGGVRGARRPARTPGRPGALAGSARTRCGHRWCHPNATGGERSAPVSSPRS